MSLPHVLVNTTPVGMFPNADGCPVSDSVINAFAVIVDIVYNPIYTKLLQKAAELGKKAVGGMFEQAFEAVRVGVVSVKFSTGIDHGIYRAYILRLRRQDNKYIFYTDGV